MLLQSTPQGEKNTTGIQHDKQRCSIIKLITVSIGKTPLQNEKYHKSILREN